MTAVESEWDRKAVEIEQAFASALDDLRRTGEKMQAARSIGAPTGAQSTMTARLEMWQAYFAEYQRVASDLEPSPGFVETVTAIMGGLARLSSQAALAQMLAELPGMESESKARLRKLRGEAI
jgi:hypothetical protein